MVLADLRTRILILVSAGMTSRRDNRLEEAGNQPVATSLVTIV